MSSEEHEGAEATPGSERDVDFDCPVHGHRTIKIVKGYTGWVGHVCPECKREEIERWEADRRDYNRKIEEENRQRRVIENLSRSGIPERYKDKTFANYHAAEPKACKAVATCREYVAGFKDILRAGESAGRSLIMCGTAGTGKTHLACAVVDEAVRTQGISAKYTTVGRLLRAVKDTYRRNGDRTEEEAIASFVAPALLVIDEVGIQFGSDTEKNILFEIINMRYEGLKPTILVSNLALTALGGYVGDRIIDRMKENGGKLIVFDWKSHRGAA